MLLAQCRNCNTTATITEHDTDPHKAVVEAGCTNCCTEDHDHGQATDETGVECHPLHILAIGGPMDAGEPNRDEITAEVMKILSDPRKAALVMENARKTAQQLGAITETEA